MGYALPLNLRAPRPLDTKITILVCPRAMELIFSRYKQRVRKCVSVCVRCVSLFFMHFIVCLNVFLHCLNVFLRKPSYCSKSFLFVSERLCYRNLVKGDLWHCYRRTLGFLKLASWRRMLRTTLHLALGTWYLGHSCCGWQGVRCTLLIWEHSSPETTRNRPETIKHKRNTHHTNY